MTYVWMCQAGDKKSAVLDLSKHVDQRVRVKFTGGREGQCRALLCVFWAVLPCVFKAKAVAQHFATQTASREGWNGSQRS